MCPPQKMASHAPDVSPLEPNVRGTSLEGKTPWTHLYGHNAGEALICGSTALMMRAAVGEIASEHGLCVSLRTQVTGHAKAETKECEDAMGDGKRVLVTWFVAFT